MEEERKKKKILPVVALVCVTILIIALGSYAYWQITRKQEGKNVVGTACLNITYGNESGDINLAGSWPMSEEEALTKDPYQFTITNNCDTEVNYSVALESLLATGNESTNYLDYKYVRVKIDDEESKTYEELTAITKDDGVRETKEITHHTLAGNDNVTHQIRIWVDVDTPLEEDNTRNDNKYFYGKVKVVAGQGIEGDLTETRYNLTFKSVSDIKNNLKLLSSGSHSYSLDDYIQPVFLFESQGNVYALHMVNKTNNDPDWWEITFVDLANDKNYMLYFTPNHDSLTNETWWDPDSDIIETPLPLYNVQIITDINQLKNEFREFFEEGGNTLVSNVQDLSLIFDIEEVSNGNNVEALTYPITGTSNDGITYELTSNGKLILGGTNEINENKASELASDIVHQIVDSDDESDAVFDMLIGKESYEDFYDEYSNYPEEVYQEAGLNKEECLASFSRYRNLVTVNTIEFTDEVSSITIDEYDYAIYKFRKVIKLIASNDASINVSLSERLPNLTIDRRSN